MSQSRQANDAVTAGRGFLLITSAKLYFILVSAFLALGLPRLLGDPGLFGRYRTINAFVSILNMVMIVGTIQSVSKLVSEDERRASHVKQIALRVQAYIGGALALAIVIFAEAIANFLFRDSSLAIYLRVGAVVTFFYSIYAVYVGLLNGSKQFARQAALDALFSTLKVGLIVALVVAGYGVLGAFSGFAVAAAIITLTSTWTVPRKLPSGNATIVPKQLTALLVPILATTFFINLMVQLDVLILKGFVVSSVDAYLETNEGHERIAWLMAPLASPAESLTTLELAQEAADRLAGLFGGAKNLALLPYQLTFAITFVVFPLVSNATYSNDQKRAQQTVRQSMRFALLVAVAAGVVLISVGQDALGILLGSQYVAATPALNFLVLTTVCVALTVLGLTILNSAGMEKQAFGISLVIVVLYVVVLWLLLPTATDLREGILTRTAQASLLTMIAGMSFVFALLHRRFGPPCSVLTLLRTGSAAVAVIGLMQFWLAGALAMLILKALSSIILFALVLFVTRELDNNDLDSVRRILGSKSQ